MIQNFYDFQDDGLIFLWVTGRAMELGRECLKLWGYERVDELIWVKTNQLQRIIRTGRNVLHFYILQARNDLGLSPVVFFPRLSSQLL